MEGGVEDRDLAELRERMPGLADSRERRCVVQRRELGQARKLELDRVIDQRRLAEARTAVHYAMGDRLDVIRRLGERAAHLRQRMEERRLAARAYTREHGDDDPEIRDWTWPY